MRRIDATKIGDADLAQLAILDMMINILTNDDDSIDTVVRQLDLMRDREDLITRSAKQGLLLDDRLASEDFLLSVKSELALTVDRLREQSRAILIHASEYQRAERKTAQSAQPFATCAEATKAVQAHVKTSSVDTGKYREPRYSNRGKLLTT